MVEVDVKLVKKIKSKLDLIYKGYEEGMTQNKFSFMEKQAAKLEMKNTKKLIKQLDEVLN